MKPPQSLAGLSRHRHMQVRAKQRFGLEVGKLARHALIRKVHEGDVKYIRKLTNSRTVVVTEYERIEVTFIYSSAAKSIVTFLPPNAVETAEWRASQKRNYTSVHASSRPAEGFVEELG